jgi:tRNA pseudouridine32 synthase / 23S rRNA pseudouridine746 synthase
VKTNRHVPRGIEILHDDRDLYVISKQAGILTTGTGRARQFTAEQAMNDYIRKGNDKVFKQVYLVHRIDRGTSGLLLFAKSALAQRRLQEDWNNTEKGYLAVVHGRLKEARGLLSSYLAESATFRVYSVRDPAEGRLALTAYAVMATAPRFSLVKIRLLTGRKHQIRVQFADLGNPVYGDDRYGPPHSTGRRLYLHAKTLAFNHPHDNRRLTFDTPIPKLFTDLFPGLECRVDAPSGAAEA